MANACPTSKCATIAIDPTSGEWTFLPDGQTGNLVLHGPNIFAGYLTHGPNGPQISAGDKLRDGWLDTGDLASADPDEFIHLVGRAKDLIIRGGHNIDPRTIEDALLEPSAATPNSPPFGRTPAGLERSAIRRIAAPSNVVADLCLASPRVWVILPRLRVDEVDRLGQCLLPGTPELLLGE